jgi:hypothetical protein
MEVASKLGTRVDEVSLLLLLVDNVATPAVSKAQRTSVKVHGSSAVRLVGFL